VSDRVETYDVTGVPSIEIAAQAGDIVIKPSDEPRVKIVLTGNAEAVDLTQVDASPESISIRSRHTKGRFFNKRVDMVINAPPGGYLKIDLASGQIRVRIPLAELAITTGSGDIRVYEPVGSVRIKVASGDISLSDVVGDADITAASGDIKIPSAGDVTVSTASGDVRIGEVARTIAVKSASGDVGVKRFGGSDIDITTMSGNVSIGLVPGLQVKASVKTLSGDFRNRIKPTEGDRTGSMSLRVKSFTGDVTLRSAP
jgi:DUF4097 and DUF4098 domain-containing protein YvlB